MNVIDISGVRYIKASDAARAVGYTTDYVGQLARAGKVAAQQIGRAWYVKEDDIRAHKRDAYRSNKQKTREAVQKAVHAASADEKHAIYHSAYTPPSDMPHYRKRLLESPVTYEADNSPLTPIVQHEEAENKHISVIGEDSESKTAIKKDITVETESSHASRLDAERAPEPPMRGTLAVFEAVSEGRDVSPTPQPSDRAEEHTRVEQNVFQPGTKRSKTNLTFIPHRNKATKFPQYAQRTLLALSLVGALIFAASGVFLEKVLVYEKLEGNISSSYSAHYPVEDMAAVIRSISR